MIGRLLHRAKDPHLDPVATTAPSFWPWSSDVLAEPALVATESEALDLPVVSGFLRILSSLVSQMPLRAYQGTEVVEPTPMLLRNPSPAGNLLLNDFLRGYLYDVALYGNFVALRGDPDWTGWPAVLYPVPWGAWSMDHHGHYDIGGHHYEAHEVLHVCVNCRTGEHVGRGLLQTHRRLIATAAAAESWASMYFLGGAVPPVVASHPNSELTQEGAELLKAKLRAATRTRTAVVVPQGTTITPLASDADGAQLNETRRWNAQQLCQAVGIPAALLGLDAPGLTYRNVQDVFRQFVSTTVMGYVAPLEEALSTCLPRTMQARFDTKAVLRPDLAERVNIATHGLSQGLFTADEARALLDLPPLQDTADVPPQLAVVSQEAANG